MSLYHTCPKCGYKCQTDAAGDPDMCPRCGLVFSKWMKQHVATSTQIQNTSSRRELGEKGRSQMVRLWQRLWEQVMFIDTGMSVGQRYLYAAIYLVFFMWGWSFILMDYQLDTIGHSFMHRIDLVFHEAGHVAFSLFGRFIMILGGSLGQLLMPLVVILALIFKNRDPFGASIGLWWLAQSLMDLAPYINDARAMQLTLLGGGTGRDRPGMHDWHNILASLGLLDADHTLATLTNGLGVALMLLSFAWGGYILIRQFQRQRYV
jgi:hypothetical protein